MYVSNVVECLNQFTNAQIVYCLKTWKFIICLTGQNLGMLELNFIWPAIGQVTGQLLYWALCCIFRRSSGGDFLFLLTTLYSLSHFIHYKNAWNAVSSNLNFLKFYRGSIPLDPPRNLHLHCSHPPPPPRKILATRLQLLSVLLSCHLSYNNFWDTISSSICDDIPAIFWVMVVSVPDIVHVIRTL